jgi:hypothetical protein
MWAVKHPLALLQTEAKLKADLASKALADGLASQNPLIRARAEQTKAYLEGQIAQLDPYWAYQGAQASQSLSDSLSSEYPTIKSQARALVNQLNADFANLKTNYSIHVSSPGTNAGKNRYGGVALRAGGGPVDPGGTYIVGEKGPEVLHMGSGSGHITPNGAASQPIQIFLDGKKIFDVIDARMGKRLAMTSSASYTRG